MVYFKSCRTLCARRLNWTRLLLEIFLFHPNWQTWQWRRKKKSWGKQSKFYSYRKNKNEESTDIKGHISAGQTEFLKVRKLFVPVRWSAHLLLLVSAGGRVSVSIVVEAVEGVVGAVEHVCTSRSGTRDPECSAPLTLLAKAQQQQPVLPLRSATMLCSASWRSLWAVLLMAACSPPLPPPRPSRSPGTGAGLEARDHLPRALWAPRLLSCSCSSVCLVHLNVRFVLSPGFFSGCPGWSAAPHLSN